ncbi:MAG: tetratricopeptide repeat protein [Endomicrobia bacterium]|nr:tetratricopeptide repeat protein [Endomicrobiia bacterium]
MKNLKLLILLISFVVSFCHSSFDLGISYFLDEKYELSEVMFKRNNFYKKEKDISNDFYLAYSLYLNNKINDAKEIYKKLYNEISEDKKLKIYASLMYAECCVLLKDYEEALSVYDSILKTDINYIDYGLVPYIFYGKIYCLYNLKRYNDALITISLFKTYISKQKNLKLDKELEEQLDYILGECWYNKGNYKKAVEIFKNFATKYKNSYLYLNANFKLFLIYEAQKNYKDAEIVLKLLEEKVPKEQKWIIKYNIARILSKQKKFNQSIKIYQEILSDIIDKKLKSFVELMLSYCFYQLKNYQKAIEILSKIDCSGEEININKYYLLGLSYFNNKNYNEAIQIFSKFLKLYPPNVKWYDDVIYWLGVSYYKNKQYTKSIQTFSLLKSKKSSVYYLSACLYIAKSYKELKEYDLAKLILTSLLDLKDNQLNDNSLCMIFYELAENYKLSYEFQIALQYYKKILEKNIDDTYLLLSTKISIAEIYNHLNDYKESEKILSELLSSNEKIPESLNLKIKLLYLSTKYNLADITHAEKIATELIYSYSNKLSIEEIRYVVNLLSKIYAKNNNYNKFIDMLEKLSSVVNQSEEKFLIDLRILRILSLANDFNKLYNKIVKIQKENKSISVLGITDYYLTKYYLLTDNKKEFFSTLYKFSSYSIEGYKYFNYEELSNLLDICIENSSDIAVQICENIIPNLNFETKQKLDIVKNVIENLIAKKEYNKVLKLASLVKRISYDPFTSSYSEFIIAKIYEITQKNNWAENMYKEIIEKYPNSPYIPKIYLSLIRYYKNINDNEKMRLYEELLLGKYPTAEETYEYLYEKAQCLISNNDYYNAIEILRKLTNSKTYGAISQKLIADCYFNLKEYKKASVEYLRVIYLYPDNIELSSEAQYMVGVCAEKLNLYSEAKKAYINSKEKYPNTLWAQEAEFRLKKLK